MKKKIVICTFIVIFFIVVWQIFGICYHRGNLVFSIWNESGKNGRIEIFIDGHNVKNLEKETRVYHYHSTFVSPKNHKLVIKFNGFLSQEVKFNTILFTLIYVDLQKDSFYNPNESVRFSIKKSKWPLLFIL